MSDLVRFGLKRGHRTGEYLGCALYLVMFLLVGVFTWAILDVTARRLMPNSPTMARLLSSIGLAAPIWLWWRLVRPRVQWSVEVDLDQLRIGTGPSAESISLDDVDLLRLKPFDGKRSGEDWLEIQCGGYRRRLELGADATGCALLLRERCRRAIFVDQNGREYAPAWNDDTQATLTVAGSHRRRVLLRTVATTVGWAAAATFSGYLLATRSPISSYTAISLGLLAFGGTLGALVGSFRTVTAWKRWRSICNETRQS